MFGDLVLDEEGITRGAKLGQGGFGTVFRGTYKGTPVAVKDLKEPSSDPEMFIKYLLREVQVMSKMEHPAIIKLVGCRMPNNTGRAVIVMELGVRGSLGGLLDDQFVKNVENPEWTPTRKSKCVFGVAAGLLHIHSRGFIHRDMKPENILLDENYEPKICDFGRARMDSVEKSAVAPTPLTTAPEAMEGYQYTNKIDVYSYGMTLYLMFTKPTHLDDNTPIGKSTLILMRKVSAGARYPHVPEIPPFYWDLIRACWDQNPAARPTVGQIVKLLETDDRWVFDGTDRSDLDRYKRMVMADLKGELDRVPEFDPKDASTAIPIAELGEPTKMIDLANLASKLKENEDFDRIEECASASGDPVFKVKSVDDGQIYWLKEVRTRDCKYYMREIEAMAMINHPAVMSMAGWQAAGRGREVLIITNWCQNEGVAHMLSKDWTRQTTPGWWDGTRKSMVVVGVACAMNEVHKRDFTHRHLTPEAIFFDKDTKPRVGDFGRDQTDLTQGAVYTRAPELFSGGVHYSLAVDVYAYGMILYAMFRQPNTFARAAGAAADHEIVQNVRNGQRFVHDPSIPPFYWQIITACWKQQPQDRPTFSDIVEKLRGSNQAYAFPGTNSDELRAYEAEVLPSPFGRSTYVWPPVDAESSPSARAQAKVDKSPPQRGSAGNQTKEEKDDNGDPCCTCCVA